MSNKRPLGPASSGSIFSIIGTGRRNQALVNQAGIAVAAAPLRRSSRPAAHIASARNAELLSSNRRSRPRVHANVAVDENLSDDEADAGPAPALQPAPVAQLVQLAPAHAAAVIAPAAAVVAANPVVAHAAPHMVGGHLVARSGTLNNPGVGCGGPGFFDQTRVQPSITRVDDPRNPPHYWEGMLSQKNQGQTHEIKITWRKSEQLNHQNLPSMMNAASRFKINTPAPFGNVVDYTVQFARQVTDIIMSRWSAWHHMKYQIYANIEQGDPDDEEGDWSRATQLRAYDTYRSMPSSYPSAVAHHVDNRPQVSLAQQYAGLIIRDGFDIDMDVVESSMTDFAHKIEQYASGEIGGSAFQIKAINWVKICLVAYQPSQGGAKLKLPTAIVNKHCCINPDNDDEACFEHALRCFWYHDQLQQRKSGNHFERISMYANFPEADIDFSMITRPMSVDKNRLERFETANQVCLNVWTYRDSNVKCRPYDFYKLYATRQNHAPVCNLIYISNEDHTRFHYAWIKNLSALLNTTEDHHWWCHRCQNKFTKKARYQQHMAMNECFLAGERAVQISLPDEKNSVIEFSRAAAETLVPYVIIADFECYCQPLTQRECTQSRFTPLEHALPDSFHHEHIPNSYSYQVIDAVTQVTADPVTYNGLNPCFHFVKTIMNLTRSWCYQWINTNGSVAGFKVVVGFHNGKRYDFHPIMDGIAQIIEEAMNEQKAEALGISYEALLLAELADQEPVDVEDPSEVSLKDLCQSRGWCMRTLTNKLRLPSLTVTPKTNEDYLAIRFGLITFMDTMNLQAASLDALVKRLEPKDFVLTDRYFGSRFGAAVAEKMHRKGVYPYEYMEGPLQMQELKLPPLEAFYSSLSQASLKPDDYEFAQYVWQTFECKTMEDYHNWYNTHDTLLQSDVFVRHRNICLQNFQLDPFHFISTPGYAFQSMLKKTEVKLDLITGEGVDQVIFVERMIRGGISMIGEQRYARSNSTMMICHPNPEIQARFDPTMPETQIQYYDMKNLYGWCMSQYLPQGGYAWNQELWDEARILSIPLDAPVGYFFEVDLETPEELHDWMMSLPAAPVRRAIVKEELSPVQRWLAPNYKGTEKLICDLHPKQKYGVHYRTLQVYLEMGVKLVAVHRVLQFQQSDWLRPYVEQCKDLRAQATTEFEKDFWKLMVNAIYGKLMENVRKYLRFELAASPKSFQRYCSHPDFEGYVEFRKDTLMGVRIRRTQVMMNKPIAIGAAILDISKAHMYHFWYKEIKTRFDPRIKPADWPFKVHLLMMDTDSFCFELEGPPVPEMTVVKSGLVATWMDLHAVIDASTYPPDHFMYHSKFATQIGVMKDECCGELILEFVGLRAKMYAYNHIPLMEGIVKKHSTSEIIDKKVAKGIPRFIIKNQMSLDLYKQVLGQPRQVHRVEYDQFRSLNHRIYTSRVSKIGLRAFDDKRFLADGIYSWPHGHYLSELALEEAPDDEAEKAPAEYEKSTLKLIKI